MDGCYEVCLGRQPVGKVQVMRQGLYYRFLCNCRLTGNVVCRLTVRCGENQEKLGVLVPEGDGFALDKKIPVKHLGEGKLEFYLGPNHDHIMGEFIPVYPEEPFSYIARLKDAFLYRQNGKLGVMLKDGRGQADHTSSSRLTGQ